MRTVPEDDLNGDIDPLLAGLARERDPGRAVEERVVAALRREGALRAGSSRRRAATRLLAVAASVVLFAGGVLAGEYHARLRDTRALAAQHDQDLQEAAAFVQRTGSQYVEAVARLAQIAASGQHADQAAQGREAAVSALQAAALELRQVRSADPGTNRILEVIAAAIADQAGAAGSTRRLIWF